MCAKAGQRITLVDFCARTPASQEPVRGPDHTEYPKRAVRRVVDHDHGHDRFNSTSDNAGVLI